MKVATDSSTATIREERIEGPNKVLVKVRMEGPVLHAPLGEPAHRTQHGYARNRREGIAFAQRQQLGHAGLVMHDRAKRAADSTATDCGALSIAISRMKRNRERADRQCGANSVALKVTPYKYNPRHFQECTCYEFLPTTARSSSSINTNSIVTPGPKAMAIARPVAFDSITRFKIKKIVGEDMLP